MLAVIQINLGENELLFFALNKILIVKKEKLTFLNVR